MSQAQQIKERIRTLMAEEFQKDASVIDDETPFDHYDVDSLQAAQLIAAIEDEFEIFVTDEDLPKINTLNALADVVMRELGDG